MDYHYRHNPPYERGDEIRMYQDKLNYIRNTYHYGWDYIKVDGIFGPRTRNAVKGFQATFTGKIGSGDLDASTQSLIMSKFYECQRGYSANPNVARGYNPYMTYADQGYHEIANYTIGRAAYVQSPRSFSETSVKAAKGNDDQGFTLEYFKQNYQNNLYGIFQDFYSILDEVSKLPVGKRMLDVGWTKIKDLFPKIVQLAQKAVADAKRLANLVAGKVNEFIKPIKDYSTRLLNKFKTNPQAEIKNLTKSATKSGKGGGVAGLVLAGIPMVYYLIRWIIAAISGNDTEYYKKEFFSNLKSFIGAVIIMVLIELLGMALTAAGVAASTVGLVVAIVAIVIAVVDLIVVGLTGKGIGDWIMTGLSNFGEYLGNKAWEATQWVEEKRTVGVQIFAYGFEYWDKKFS